MCAICTPVHTSKVAVALDYDGHDMAYALSSTAVGLRPGGVVVRCSISMGRSYWYREL